VHWKQNTQLQHQVVGVVKVFNWGFNVLGLSHFWKAFGVFQLGKHHCQHVKLYSVVLEWGHDVTRLVQVMGKAWMLAG